jgi:hypothetical protein
LMDPNSSIMAVCHCLLFSASNTMVGSSPIAASYSSVS